MHAAKVLKAKLEGSAQFVPSMSTVTNFMYSVIVARCSAVGPSLLLAQRTHCQTTFEIRHCHHMLFEPG